MQRQNGHVGRRDFNLGLASLIGAAAASPLIGGTVLAKSQRGVPAPSFVDEAADRLSRYGLGWGRSVVASARSHGAMIASTRGGRPMDDALKIMRRGGNAADAVTSMAVAQVVHAMGGWVSFAGLLTLVYYEAKTGKVHSMCADWNTVQGEKDPMSIPLHGLTGRAKPEESGREVLVPGFMRGVEAVNARFGSIPFARLFDSAIGMAERGMEVDAGLERTLGRSPQSPAAAAIFRKADGAAYKAGEVFRQPAVARTLRAVAEEGADYMYTGLWAERFVADVRACGGKMSMKDLADYHVRWREPLHTNYKGVDIYSLQDSHSMHGALRLAREGRLAEMGRYYENPDVFYYYHKIFRSTGTNMTIVADRINHLPVPLTDWLDDTKVAAYWPLIRDGKFPSALGRRGMGHTDAIVVVDRAGNVASVMHSTGSILTGRYVDGVSVPGPAGYQQGYIRQVGPGKPLPTMVPNTIGLKNGRPVLATAAAGTALHQETLKVITNLVDYGKAGRESIQAPSFVEPYYPETTGVMDSDEIVLTGDYAPEFLDAVRAKGMEVTEVAQQGSGGASVNIEPRRGADTPTSAAAGSGDAGKLTPPPATVQSSADPQRPWRVSVNTAPVVLVVIDPSTGEREGVSARNLGDAKGF